LQKQKGWWHWLKERDVKKSRKLAKEKEIIIFSS